MIRVAIADDHRIVREGLALMLADVDDVQLVGEAEDGETLMELLAGSAVDVVLLDVRMPGMGGLEALEAIRDRFTDVQVVVLSMHDDPAYVTRAIELGAGAYLLKNTTRDELVHAVRLVATGKTYIQGELIGLLVDRIHRSEEDSERPELTPRAGEVLRLLALGRSNSEIADELGIAEATVKSHVRSLYTQLGVSNRAEAVAVALRMGLID